MADAAIRSFAAVELMILINAEEITARSVAVSLCVFLFAELSVLAERKKRWLSDLFLAVSFAVTGDGFCHPGGRIEGNRPDSVCFRSLFDCFSHFIKQEGVGTAGPPAPDL